MVAKQHTHQAYEAELSDVRENLLRMAGWVEQMIADAVRSLRERSTDLANDTIERDHRVNRFEVDIDELCLRILAKRQPMASDLRFITLAMKMVTDLERIGDLAVNICERTLALAALPAEPIPDRISRMSAAARALVADAIDAFVARDVDKALQVWERDSEVDDLYEQIYRAAQARVVQDPARLERAMHIQAVAKFLERIADHATNLAEMVVWLVDGKDVRHIGKL